MHSLKESYLSHRSIRTKAAELGNLCSTLKGLKPNESVQQIMMRWRTTYFSNIQKHLTPSQFSSFMHILEQIESILEGRPETPETLNVFPDDLLYVNKELPRENPLDLAQILDEHYHQSSIPENTEPRLREIYHQLQTIRQTLIQAFTPKEKHPSQPKNPLIEALL